MPGEGEADKQEQRECGNERDCRADIWYIAVGEQRTESGNEKQEEVEPRPNPSLYSLTAKLDLSGLK